MNITATRPKHPTWVYAITVETPFKFPEDATSDLQGGEHYTGCMLAPNIQSLWDECLKEVRDQGAEIVRIERVGAVASMVSPLDFDQLKDFLDRSRAALEAAVPYVMTPNPDMVFQLEELATVSKSLLGILQK